MITWLAVASCLAVTVAFVILSFREQRRVRRMIAALLAGIELRTRESGALSASGTDRVEAGRVGSEWEELLDEALLHENGPNALCAVHELEAQAKLSRMRVLSLSRAAGRVPFLTGLAAAIVIVALGRAQMQVLTWAGACVGISLLGSVAASLLCRKGHSAARRFAELCRELARQVEGRWSVSSSSSEVRSRGQDEDS